MRRFRAVEQAHHRLQQNLIGVEFELAQRARPAGALGKSGGAG